jgi:hypothetical membrane protein
MNYGKAAGSIILAGVFQFLLFLTLAEEIYPSYSVSRNYISDLGVGRTALIFNGSIIVLGVLLIASGILLRLALKSTALSVMLILSGVGSAGVGIFPETTGAPHTIFAFITFLFGSLAAIYCARVVRGPMRVLSPIAGVISLISLIAFATHQYWILGPGGMERLIAYPELWWGLGLGGWVSTKG